MFVLPEGQWVPHLSGQPGFIIDEGDSPSSSLSLSEWSRTAERKNQQRATSSEEIKNIKVKARWKKRLEVGWKGQKDVKKDERRLKEGKVAGIKWDKKTKPQDKRPGREG